MGSLMRQELVAIKTQRTWDIIFNVALSEGKNIVNPNDAIDIIKSNYNDLLNCEFIVSETEIYALTDSEFTINPGNSCKI